MAKDYERMGFIHIHIDHFNDAFSPIRRSYASPATSIVWFNAPEDLRLRDVRDGWAFRSITFLVESREIIKTPNGCCLPIVGKGEFNAKVGRLEISIDQDKLEVGAEE